MKLTVLLTFFAFTTALLGFAREDAGRAVQSKIMFCLHGAVIVNQHDLIVEDSAQRLFIPELMGLVPSLL